MTVSNEKPPYRFGPFVVCHKSKNGHTWVINTLGGGALCLSSEEWGLLSQASPNSASRRRLHQALMECNLISSGNADAEFYYHIVKAQYEWPNRLGILLDYATAIDLRAAANAICQKSGETKMLYLWFNSPEGEGRLSELLELVSSQSGGAADVQLSIHSNAAVPISNQAIDSLSTLKLKIGESMVVFTITEEDVQIAGGSRPLARSLFAEHSRYFSLGLLPVVIFRCTSTSWELLLGSLFTEICSTGFYPRNMYAVFARESDRVSRLCELYHWDWDLYELAVPRIHVDSNMRLLEALGGGLPDKLRAVLRNGREAISARLCPFGTGGTIYGGGRIARCPVILAQSIQDDTSVPHPFNEGDGHSEDQAWVERTPLSIPGCQKCRVAPMCGGGCGLEAFEEAGTTYASPCPPILRILEIETELATNLYVSKTSDGGE